MYHFCWWLTSSIALAIYVQDRRDMKTHQGSYTIEAAIWVPLVMLVIATTLHLAIVLVQEAAEREPIKWLVEQDPTQEFYHYQVLEEIGEEIIGD